MLFQNTAILPAVTVTATATATAATAATATAATATSSIAISTTSALPKLPIGQVTPNYQSYSFVDQSYDYKRNLLDVYYYEPGSSTTLYRTDVGFWQDNYEAFRIRFSNVSTTNTYGRLANVGGVNGLLEEASYLAAAELLTAGTASLVPWLARSYRNSKVSSIVFRSFTKSNFRVNLSRLTRKLPSNAHAHHVFPQKFKQEFAKRGININNPKFGSWWEASSYLKNAKAYNTQWQNFLNTNPNTSQIFKFGRQLMNQYGLPVGF
jgi:hypothetical protein